MISWVIAVCMATSGCGDRISSPSADRVPLGREFSLAVGQSAVVGDAGLRVSLKGVAPDSRCPVDVQCVWEGDAKVEVVIARAGSPDETKLLSIKAPNNETRVGNLKIRFVGLTPVPRQADAGAPKNYLAEFVAEQA